MKSLWFVVPSLFVAGLASADPTPAATSVMAPVIAEVEQAGGYMPSTSPVRHTLQILASGQVISVDFYRDGRVETRPVAWLEADRVSALLRVSKDLAPASLELENPNAPMCADAPWTTYRVRNGQGVLVDLKAERDCRDFVRPDRFYTPVPRILDGLLTLNYL